MTSDEALFRRIAAISAIVSGPLAWGASAIVVTAVVDFDLTVASDLARLVGLGPGPAEAFRWAEFLGMFGYYLLLTPLALYLWGWLRPQSPYLVTMSTVVGLAGIFVGAIGSAVLTGVLPPMMVAYSEAAGPEQERIVAAFLPFGDLVLVALFSLQGLLMGLWWLVVGVMLRRERRILGIATIALGVGSLIYGAGTMLDVDLLTGLGPVAFLAPAWAVWAGAVVWAGTGGVHVASEAGRPLTEGLGS
jgi:hypothetical protein